MPKTLRVQVPNQKVSTQNQYYGSQYGNTNAPWLILWTLKEWLANAWLVHGFDDKGQRTGAKEAELKPEGRLKEGARGPLSTISMSGVLLTSHAVGLISSTWFSMLLNMPCRSSKPP